MNYLQTRAFYAAQDYDAVCSWWRSHNWTPLPIDALSTRGIIVEFKETKERVCAAWVYKTDSCLGWLEWVIANPAIALRKRLLGLDLLVREAVAVQDRLGIKFMHTSAKSRGLIKLYKKHGFLLGDEQMTNLIRGCQ